MTGCQTCGGYGMHHDPIAHDAEVTRWTVCVLCDGVGQVHDYEIYNLEGCISCPDCGGLGEIEYVPVEIRRRESAR